MAKVIYKRDGTAMVIYTREELHDIIQGARKPEVTEVKGERHVLQHLTPAQRAMMEHR